MNSSGWLCVVHCLLLLEFLTVQGAVKDTNVPVDCDFDFACSNGGTPSGDCSRCECRSGWTGRTCTVRCGGVLNSSTGYLTSPGFPEPYSSYEHCVWKFNYPLFLSFRFSSFDLQSGLDFVRVKDDSQDYMFTGNFLPQNFEGFLDSNAEISFISNGSVAGKGFSLEYESVAGSLPWFVLTPSDTIVLQNETKSLFCYAQGFPEPHISWEKDGEKLPLAPKLAYAEIHIENADAKRDTGVYICNAENYMGKIRRAFFVEVHVPPIIINPPVGIQFEEAYFFHQDIYFRCDAYGIPEPKVYWKKNGTFLINSSYVSSSVRWLRVRMQSGAFGNYSCYANNSAGATESRPAVLSSSRQADRYSTLSNKFWVNNSFWNQVNSSILFELYYRRKSKINFQILKIFKDGKLWNSSSVSLPYKSHYRYDVEFGPSKPEDSGIYRFHIDFENKRRNFSIFAPLKIRVSPRPRIFSPKYISSDFIEPLTFKCADDNSDPLSTFTWFSEGRKINDEKTNGSYAIFHSLRQSYLLVRNLTSFLYPKPYRVHFNFTCQSTASILGESKNASVVVGNYFYESGPFSPWSSSLQSYCSETRDTKFGFRLRHRICLRKPAPCSGPSTRIESCSSSIRNCSSSTEIDTAFKITICTTGATTSADKSSESSSNILSHAAVAGITFAAIVVAISVVIIIVRLVQRNQSPTCTSAAAAAAAAAVETPSDMLGTSGGNTYMRGPRAEAPKKAGPDAVYRPSAAGANYEGEEIPRVGSDLVEPKEMPIYADIKYQLATYTDNVGYSNDKD